MSVAASAAETDEEPFTAAELLLPPARLVGIAICSALEVSIISVNVL